MRKYNISSDLVQVKSFQPIVYKQYDNGDNLEVELFDDGKKINLTDEIVLAFFELEDGTVIQKTCTVNENGNAVATLDNNVLSIGGKLKTEFTVYKDGKETTTRTIIITVEQSINRNESIETIPQWDIVHQVLDLKASDGSAIEEKINVLNEAVEVKFNELAAAAQVDSEVVLARGGEVTLGQRLDKVSSSLAEMSTEVSSLDINKANKAEVDTELGKKLDKTGTIAVTQIDKNKGLFDQTYLTDELKQQIAGTTPINAVPAPNSITLDRLAFSPVLGLKSSNLFDKSTVIPDAFVVPDSGVLSGGAYYSASAFINVLSNTAYITRVELYSVAFYNSDKVFISSLTSTSSFTTPSDARFCRMSMLTADVSTQQLNEGTVLLPYEEVGTKFDGSTILDKSIPLSKLDDSIIETFDETVDKLVLPSAMYLVDGESLPIYKSSIISNASLLNHIKTILINTDTPRYSTFEDILLDSSKVGNSFKIGLNQHENTDFNYFRQIQKKSVAATANSGKTINYLAIGDSLTENIVPYLIRSKFEQYGVTIRNIGTFAGYGAEGYGFPTGNGFGQEGRSSWSFANFIGLNNIWGSNGLPILPHSSGYTTDRNQNPFLKLANATDKTNHPTWCFRNTGAIKEKSYAEDSDKSGNFYIFDFAHYITSHNLLVPDVVTIALGTNDIWSTTETSQAGLNNCKLGLEIMIKQINTAYPTIKIGVIPQPAVANTKDGNAVWKLNFSKWIDIAIADVELYKQTIPNVDIVPIWCHMNREWNWDESTAQLDSVNKTLKGTRGDYVHFNANGRKEYSNASIAWIMNVI